jgi:hypothetical protein
MSEVKKFYDVDGRAIRFRNFEGKAARFNAEGDRNFCLILNDEDAEELKAEGFNVRYLKPRNEYDEPLAYLPVKVDYSKGRPPKIVQVTKRGKTELDEESVRNLDWAEIDKADISINPYHYKTMDREGIKAYLKTMYVTIVEDDFEDRYYDIPDSARSSDD